MEKRGGGRFQTQTFYFNSLNPQFPHLQNGNVICLQASMQELQAQHSVQWLLLNKHYFFPFFFHARNVWFVGLFPNKYQLLKFTSSFTLLLTAFVLVLTRMSITRCDLGYPGSTSGSPSSWDTFSRALFAQQLTQRLLPLFNSPLDNRHICRWKKNFKP